jgi:hypothetical protein
MARNEVGMVAHSQGAAIEPMSNRRDKAALKSRLQVTAEPLSINAIRTVRSTDARASAMKGRQHGRLQASNFLGDQHAHRLTMMAMYDVAVAYQVGLLPALYDEAQRGPRYPPDARLIAINAAGDDLGLVTACQKSAVQVGGHLADAADPIRRVIRHHVQHAQPGVHRAASGGGLRAIRR